MADSVQALVQNIGFSATGSGSPAMTRSVSNMGSQREAQSEAPGFELGRAGRSFVGGITAVSAGIAPVQDLPTTTAPIGLFNASPATGTARVLVVKRLSFSYASATTFAAFGSSIFAGVTPSKLATALLANGANIKTQSTRGYGTPNGYIDVALTIVQPVWMLLGGIAHGAESTTSIGYSVDLSSHPLIVPPQFCLAFGPLAGLGGSSDAKYLMGVAWDEVDCVLP